MDRYNFNYRFGLQTIHVTRIYIYNSIQRFFVRGFTGVHGLATFQRVPLFFSLFLSLRLANAGSTLAHSQKGNCYKS